MQTLFLVIIGYSVSIVLGSVAVLEGEVHQSIVLPCSFRPGEEVAIHWTIDGHQVVHSYYNEKDQLERQEKSYAGRTSLFLHEIRNGNASLQLLNLKKSDENLYSCYVGTTEASATQLEVQLKIRDAVWGEKHKTIIIPCSFTPGEDIVIYWKIANDERKVHSYHSATDQLENQDKAYKGRTSLFIDELTKGNASLQLRDLQTSDENFYSCYVGTLSGKDEQKVKVYVADFKHSIEYIAGSGVQSLKCYSSNVYEFDNVTIKWDRNNQVIQEDFNTTSVCGSCHLNNSHQSYRCTIQHSIVESIWSGTWKKNENSIVCACGSCNTTSAGFLASLYLHQNNIIISVASMNSTSILTVYEGYRNRVQGIPGGFSLSVTNLTTNDTGEYICTIKTVEEMRITSTLFTITDAGKPQARTQGRNHIRVFPAILIILVIAAFGIYRTKKNLK